MHREKTKSFFCGFSIIMDPYKSVLRPWIVSAPVRQLFRNLFEDSNLTIVTYIAILATID